MWVSGLQNHGIDHTGAIISNVAAVMDGSVKYSIITQTKEYTP
jgi:hypothetical protein